MFLCGSAGNEPDLWPLFSASIYLEIDEQTLRDRLLTRTTNDFGKAGHELDTILAWNRIASDVYRESGSAFVDSTRPLAEVVDEVLRIATP